MITTTSKSYLEALNYVHSLPSSDYGLEGVLQVLDVHDNYCYLAKGDVEATSVPPPRTDGSADS